MLTRKSEIIHHRQGLIRISIERTRSTECFDLGAGYYTKMEFQVFTFLFCSKQETQSPQKSKILKVSHVLKKVSVFSSGRLRTKNIQVSSEFPGSKFLCANFKTYNLELRISSIPSCTLLSSTIDFCQKEIIVQHSASREGWNGLKVHHTLPPFLRPHQTQRHVFSICSPFFSRYCMRCTSLEFVRFSSCHVISTWWRV